MEKINSINGHQVIFTSCRRGINGVNDGQQIFSLDENFPIEDLSILQPLFSYQAPSLPLGVLMTEDLVPSFPKSFSYRRIDNRYNLFLNTYLGKDYMGPTGRFGNFLSHHIVLPNIDCYPVEYYGSSAFRTQMTYEEVNNPDPPDNLPAISEFPAGTITLDTVAAFIGEENRIELLKVMLACLLQYSNTNKRIVISDTQENIIKWIAALQYLLPLKCALHMSFSTYLYNPAEGDWRVIGVVEEGTLFNLEMDAYIFDLVNNKMPEVQLNQHFSEFIELGYLISIESMRDFHKFVEVEFPLYESVDESLYDVYAVWQIAHYGADEHKVEPALRFYSQHCPREQCVAFIEDLFAAESVIGLLNQLEVRQELFNFLNSQASNAEQLLDLTFDMEGRLLDYDGSQEAVELLWTNFYLRVVQSYTSVTDYIYKVFMEYNRSHQAAKLFEKMLAAKAMHSPRAEFSKFILSANSSDDYQLILGVYFDNLTSPQDKEHLFDFIIENDVAFTRADILVRAAVEHYQFGKLSKVETLRIQKMWTWAIETKLDLGETPRLWFLILGIYINSCKVNTELQEVVPWAVSTAHKLRVPVVSNDLDFIGWVIPKIVSLSTDGNQLTFFLNSLKFNLSSGYIKEISFCAVNPFDSATWLKVAGYIFSFNNKKLLESFALASRKLSNRDLDELDRIIRSEHHDCLGYIENWEIVYSTIQGTGIRKVKGLLRGKEKKGRKRGSI